MPRNYFKVAVAKTSATNFSLKTTVTIEQRLQKNADTLGLSLVDYLQMFVLLAADRTPTDEIRREYLVNDNSNTEERTRASYSCPHCRKPVYQICKDEWDYSKPEDVLITSNEMLRYLNSSAMDSFNRLYRDKGNLVAGLTARYFSQVKPIKRKFVELADGSSVLRNYYKLEEACDVLVALYSEEALDLNKRELMEALTRYKQLLDTSATPVL